MLSDGYFQIASLPLRTSYLAFPVVRWTRIRQCLIMACILCCTFPVFATTWYVRPDGGTRYSTNQTNGQCNGRANLPFPGHGVNQPCAFGDVRYLWADGSYVSGSIFPGWGWVGAGGDTYIVDC